MEEQILINELEELRKDMEMENRAHTDVKNFLLKKRRFLEDKVEYWMEKYEKDTEAKSNELAQLKSDKERDLKILQELARTYDDYEVSKYFRHIISYTPSCGICVFESLI